MSTQKRKLLARKEQVIIDALDEFSPVMQLGIDKASQREAIKATIAILKDYPTTYKPKRFAFYESAPDYCAVAALNLLQLSMVQPVPGLFMNDYMVCQLLGIALDHLQKATAPF